MPSFGQRLGISVVLVLTLLGFLTPQPSAASAVPKAQPEASIQQGGESPATTTIDGQPLPPPVLARVQVLYEAAGVRDYEAIRRELPADLSDFTYSFGDPPGDSIPYWQQLKGRPELEDPVAHLPRLLRHPPATDGVSVLYPYLTPKPVEAWANEDLAYVRALGYTDADIEGFRAIGGFVGLRTAFTLNDGKWEYYVAGD